MSASEEPGYRIVIPSSRVARELDRLSNSDYQRIRAALDSLSNDPRARSSIRLQANIYRVRVGNFRIIYSVDDSARSVILGAVRRRNEGTYRDVRRLF